MSSPDSPLELDLRGAPPPRSLPGADSARARASARSDEILLRGTHGRLTAPVIEVFASVQGEGLYVGEPQTFVRLAGCPLRCRYCDTPGSWGLPGSSGRAHARLTQVSSSGERETVRASAWATPFDVACWVARAEPGPPRTVSITGGEPLVWPAFVARLRELLSPRRVHLETAGADSEALEAVLTAVDHVSLDLKLAADLGAPVPFAPGPAAALGLRAAEPPSSAEDWARTRRATLALVNRLRAPQSACGKVVLVGGRCVADYEPLFDEVRELAPALPVFLQPASPSPGAPAPARALLEGATEAALERGLSVRVVPQVHKALRLP